MNRCRLLRRDSAGQFSCMQVGGTSHDNPPTLELDRYSSLEIGYHTKESAGIFFFPFAIHDFNMRWKVSLDHIQVHRYVGVGETYRMRSYLETEDDRV